MNAAFIIVGLLGASVATVAATPGSESAVATHSADLYWWYHPSGRQCPIYPFDPNDDDTRDEARQACRDENDTYYCSYAYGTAMPAC